jgi:hypothetical protein
VGKWIIFFRINKEELQIMATKNLSVSFKNAQIDLEEGTITEFKKDSVLVYRLMDELAEFAGENKFVDITIKESSEKVPMEE